MKVLTEKRCGCKDERGKQLGKRCPLLRRRGHGAWSYRVNVPKELQPLVGKTQLRESGFATQAEAEHAGQVDVTRVLAGRQAIGSLTTGAYLDDWLERKRAVKPSTARSYEGHIRVHIRPLIGDIPLRGLTSDHIDTMFERIRRDRAGATGPGTISRIYATLRAALNDAVKKRKIDFNPISAVELPSYQPDEIEPWEAEEVGRFLDETIGDRLAAMYELMALRGLRRGEACGVTWAGLDEDRGVLTIRQQIVDNGGDLHVWSPKTRSGRRKVDLDSTMVSALLAHRMRQNEEREAFGDTWNNGFLPDDHGDRVHLTDLIFTREDGRHLDPQYVSQHMQVIARRVGLCTRIVADAAVGAWTVNVGRRHFAPEGTWTVHRDREPIGAVTVAKCVRRRGSGATLSFTAPLPFALQAGDELGENLLSRRRLHDLRHSTASIAIGAGADLVLVSKSHGHSSTRVTSDLYTHLLRPAGRDVAERITAAVPRRPPGAHRDQEKKKGG